MNIDNLFEQIGKEIAEMKESVIAREIAKTIGGMLKENGVVVNLTECTCDDVTETSFRRKYGASITGLDFTEHDKVFEDKIAKLEEKVEYYKKSFERFEKNCDKLCAENQTLQKLISDLESKETEFELPVEPIEVAKMLIDSNYEYETTEFQRAIFKMGDTAACERYNVDELEQIAEHLLVYCKHNKDQEVS